MKKAFTLAETLITLGVIGVVAALTLPTLINSYKKQVTTARLKKFNSIFNQMMLQSEAENGPSKDWKRNGDIKDEDGNLDYEANFAEERRYFEKYFAKYLQYAKIEDGKLETLEDGTVQPANHVQIFFRDGSSAHFYSGGAFSFVYDVNGPTAPNQGGIDQFVWDIWPAESAKYYYPNKLNYGTRRLWGLNESTKTRERYKNACANDNPVYCTRLLELDDWEFKKDYPEPKKL